MILKLKYGPWEVVLEGDPSCNHVRGFESVKVSYPPIMEITCRKCGRIIRSYAQEVEEPWPDENGISESSSTT